MQGELALLKEAAVCRGLKDVGEERPREEDEGNLREHSVEAEDSGEVKVSGKGNMGQENGSEEMAREIWTLKAALQKVAVDRELVCDGWLFSTPTEC